ncbi:MAG: hypothetical protein CM15mP120_14150 [Pseudomonadota bacterium]|nr:MAG: hypothetical protein CM15mP120_14150 [Pseudomonadota bacterium]
MATRPEQLAEVLNKGLAPVYLVSGDDTLLVTEACDQIVAAAKQQGFTERSVHHVETGFSWHGLSKTRRVCHCCRAQNFRCSSCQQETR